MEKSSDREKLFRPMYAHAVFSLPMRQYVSPSIAMAGEFEHNSLIPDDATVKIAVIRMFFMDFMLFPLVGLI
ncbi:MAG: hypothetical protein LBR89_01370 [Holosporales bacterium]|jgi:hypothetical protein|nr:hypothetical protein [Holosporales bacterium]